MKNERTFNKDATQDVKREPVKDTPFVVVTEDGKSFVTMGKYRLTEPIDEKDAHKWAEEITWNKICVVTALLVEELHNNLDLINKLNKEEK